MTGKSNCDKHVHREPLLRWKAAACLAVKILPEKRSWNRVSRAAPSALEEARMFVRGKRPLHAGIWVVPRMIFRPFLGDGIFYYALFFRETLIKWSRPDLHRCAAPIEETNRRRSGATSRICWRREDSADVWRWVAKFIRGSLNWTVPDYKHQPPFCIAHKKDGSYRKKR